MMKRRDGQIGIDGGLCVWMSGWIEMGVVSGRVGEGWGTHLNK